MCFGWLRSSSFTCQIHGEVTASYSRLFHQQPLRRQIMIQLSLISYPQISQSGLAFAVPYGVSEELTLEKPRRKSNILLKRGDFYCCFYDLGCISRNVTAIGGIGNSHCLRKDLNICTGLHGRAIRKQFSPKFNSSLLNIPFDFPCRVVSEALAVRSEHYQRKDIKNEMLIEEKLRENSNWFAAAICLWTVIIAIEEALFGKRVMK
ncbi:hypothetical protein CDAR_565481 [Caerostris darwini]|uniref:Uncharacterized protein n=1 Tax=Caerostris darwini TaxID=1538125 RepID=A0AAV4TSL1_9ARAC|nr:hypothetical protein CDAR_565481 [Caerostris darwini]